MGILYFLIGLIISCLFYILGKKGYLSEYLYMCYNYNNISKRQREEFSLRRYDSSNWFSTDNTIGAYVMLLPVFSLWPLVLIISITVKFLSKLIKDKDKQDTHFKQKQN